MQNCDGILIRLYTEQDMEYLYSCKADAFFKRQDNSLEGIEPDGLPLGVRKNREKRDLSVVKRLGHLGVNRPIPGVTRLHYCYDLVQKEYLLNILPPHRRDDFLQDEDVFVVLPVRNEEYLLKVSPRYGNNSEQGARQYEQADILVVLPEDSVPADAVRKCQRLNRIKEDVERGYKDRLLMGHW